MKSMLESFKPRNVHKLKVCRNMELSKLRLLPKSRDQRKLETRGNQPCDERKNNSNFPRDEGLENFPMKSSCRSRDLLRTTRNLRRDSTKAQRSRDLAGRAESESSRSSADIMLILSIFFST